MHSIRMSLQNCLGRSLRDASPPPTLLRPPPSLPPCRALVGHWEGVAYCEALLSGQSAGLGRSRRSRQPEIYPAARGPLPRARATARGVRPPVNQYSK